MTDWTKDASGRPRRGVYLFPAILTVANFFLGYFAIIKAMDGRPIFGAALILVAGVMDKLDGLVARATNTATEFVKELDSLADVITFGVAPAIISYAWGLNLLGKPGWVVAFIFLTCGTLRLARFNVTASSSDSRYFVGLSIPMAAGVPMTLILAYEHFHPDQRVLTDRGLAWVYCIIVLTIALLMVSRVRYLSFKEVHFDRQQRLLVLLALMGLIAAIAAWPGIVLSLMALAFAAHGPVMRVFRLAPGSAVRRYTDTESAEATEADTIERPRK